MLCKFALHLHVWSCSGICTAREEGLKAVNKEHPEV